MVRASACTLLLLLACTVGIAGAGQQGKAGGTKGSPKYRAKKEKEQQRADDSLVLRSRHGSTKVEGDVNWSVLSKMSQEDAPPPIRSQQKSKGQQPQLQQTQEKTSKDAAAGPPAAAFQVGEFALRDESSGQWYAEVKQASGAVSRVDLMFLASFRNVTDKEQETTEEGGKGVRLKDWHKESVMNRFREDRKAAKKERLQAAKQSGGEKV